MAAAKFSVEHAIVRSTVRLTAGATPTSFPSTGTGFFYQVTHPTTNLTRVFIVTNKHVVRDCNFVQFVLSSAPSVADLNAEHQPVGRTDTSVVLPLIGNLLNHPNPSIDLCAIEITFPYGQLLQAGRQMRSMCVDSSWVPSTTDYKNLRDIEQALVIGYPIGLWDAHNNMPIARRGTTATHPRALYEGKQNFLIDVAAFPGSSGSPVFLYESPMYRQPDGSLSPGTKVCFVGVVWGVIERALSGELRAVEIPSAITQVPVIQSSLNLAIALHSDLILEIDEIVFPGITAARSS